MQHTDNQTIISLCAASTNTLFEIGAIDKIIACTLQSHNNHPLYHTKDKVGTPKDIDIATIIKLKPQLIVTHSQANTSDQIHKLKEHGFEIYSLEAQNLSQAYQSIEHLGEKISRRTQAAKLISKIEYRIETFRQKAKKYREIPTAFFTGKQPYTVAGGDSLINQLMQINKLENIYSDIPKENPTVQLATLKILDPQLILLPDYPIELSDENALEMGKYTEHALTVFVPGDLFAVGSGLLSLPKFFDQLNSKMRRDQADDLANRSTETFF